MGDVSIGIVTDCNLFVIGASYDFCVGIIFSLIRPSFFLCLRGLVAVFFAISGDWILIFFVSTSR